jgi:RNA polymerase sigma-54 factor
MVDDMFYSRHLHEKRWWKNAAGNSWTEPSGVAQDLQECLLLQLKQKTPTESVELATDIIENQFDALPKNITIS